MEVVPEHVGLGPTAHSTPATQVKTKILLLLLGIMQVLKVPVAFCCVADPGSGFFNPDPDPQHIIEKKFY
jgi:hypothetical protein